MGLGGHGYTPPATACCSGETVDAAVAPLPHATRTTLTIAVTYDAPWR